MTNRTFNQHVQRELSQMFMETGSSDMIFDVEEHHSSAGPPFDAMQSDNNFNTNLRDNAQSLLDDNDDMEPNVFDQIHGFEDILNPVFIEAFNEGYKKDPVDDRFPLTLSEELFFFYIAFNIPRRAMQHLLDILTAHGVSGVPQSVYLLQKGLNTVSWDIINVEKGDFAYLGIQNNLEFAFENKLVQLESSEIETRVNLTLNMDGLPLFKSSRMNLWCILMQVSGVMRPLPIAIFCGVGKPNVHQFTERLCNELKSLKISGFVYQHTVVKINQVICICDSPARSFVLGTKGHAAFHGCHWCRQVGFYRHDRVAYQSIVCETRNDTQYESFKESNQLTRTPFLDTLPIFSSFPPDFMHVVCLGVVKRLLHFYCTTVKGLRLSCKIRTPEMHLLNERILSFRTYFPREFQRKQRPLTELEFFKASEFRNFLLYTGPVVFKSILSKDYYEHFLLLQIAITVFSSSSLTYLHEVAKACIDRFVFDCATKFDPCVISFNFHALLHIPEFVARYGPLNNMSAFPFENYMSIIKRRIRVTNGIFKQSINQIMSIRNLYSRSNDAELFFSPLSPNNCCILPNGDIVIVSSVFDSLVSGKLCSFSRDLYISPYPSSILGIGFYIVTDTLVEHVIPLKRAFAIPVDSEMLVIPCI
jgi:hypothetical protein